MIPAVKELFERFCESAADDLMRDGEVEFEVVFLTEADKLIVCGSAMPDADDERDTLVSMLRLVAVAHGAVAACIIAESWFGPARQDGRLASASPRRREALVVCVMYRDEGEVSLVNCKREILRDTSGKIIELSAPSAPPTAERCDESQGRLMRIMPRYQPSRHDQRVAKAMIDKFPSHVVHRMDDNLNTLLALPRLAEDEWEERFQWLPAQPDDDSYYEVLEDTPQNHAIMQERDPRLVWTQIDDPTGEADYLIVPGYWPESHAWYLTSIPWDPNDLCIGVAPHDDED